MARSEKLPTFNEGFSVGAQVLGSVEKEFPHPVPVALDDGAENGPDVVQVAGRETADNACRN